MREEQSVVYPPEKLLALYLLVPETRVTILLVSKLWNTWTPCSYSSLSKAPPFEESAGGDFTHKSKGTWNLAGISLKSQSHPSDR